MSSNTASSSTVASGGLAALDPKKGMLLALIVGLAGLALTFVAFFFEPTRVGLAGLISVAFWLSIALGMILLVMLHHLFDAGWSTSIRRMLEHGLAVFPWLGLIFLPILLVGLFKGDGGAIWKWTATATGYVADDALYQHKAAYLNEGFFALRTIFYFACWTALAWFLRKASFAQDKDGDAKWTTVNRKLSALGVIVVGLTLTFAAIDWIKALDFHWFSTMFGVWFFSSSMRAALAAIIIIGVLLVKFGPWQGGIFKAHAHMYEIGRLMLAFTIFWAYIAFSQYFLIWNVNIPEVTFFYVAREHGQWWFISILMIFAYFFFPFIFLLFYKNKVRTAPMVFISIWILTFHLLDLYFHILPARQTNYVPDYSLLSGFLLVDLAAFIGVGGICVWAFLRSFVTQKAIPIRDPRIMEAINHNG